VLFVPFALFDRDAYAAKASVRFAAMGYELTSIHEVEDQQESVESAEAVFIGAEIRSDC
jgi:dipeptidase E